jgi:hypothetical protein
MDVSEASASWFRGDVSWNMVVSHLTQPMDGHALTLVTAHLPHTGNADDEYAAALSSLQHVVQNARQKRRAVIAGVDANAVVGQPLEHDDRFIVGRWGWI